MKERVETFTDFFVDYKGDTHHFVIAAVSIEFPTKYNQLFPKEKDDDSSVSYEVDVYTEYDSDYICDVVKGVKLGISICHPNDKFDENVGMLKAIAKAKEAEYAILSTKLGYINTTMIQGLLRQEANYIKNNPEIVIKGYNESKKKYFDDLAMKETELNGLEIEIFDELNANPSFLDKVINYFKWTRKQS